MVHITIVPILFLSNNNTVRLQQRAEWSIQAVKESILGHIAWKLP